MTSPTARIIIVGNEVLAGEVKDTNGPFLLGSLAGLGVRVTGLRVVPDAEDAVEAAVREATAAADITVITGGIGPTHDDCTRPALAGALDRPLVVHPEARERLHRIFGGRSTHEEEAMALLPRDAELLVTPDSVSFAFRVGRVFVFPGVPELLHRLFAANASLFRGTPTRRREVITRIREGLIAGSLRELAAAWPDVAWGSYPQLTPEGWHLRLVLRGNEDARLDAALDALRAVLERAENTAR